MLAALTVAVACGAWQSAAVGFYPGVVESLGKKAVDAWIEQAPGGALQGHYVLHEGSRDVPGTLAAVADEGCGVAVFRWTDVYGSGLARLTFDPERHCFDGAWGGSTINPALIWHACTRERVTS